MPPVAQAGRPHEHVVRIGRLGVEAGVPQHSHQLGPQTGDGRGPGGQVDPVEQVGQGGGGQAVQRPLGLVAAEAVDVVGQHVADAQAGAGQHLGQRADHQRPVASG